VQLALSAGAYAKVSNNKGSSPIHFLCLEDNNTGRGVKEDGKSQLAILRELVDAGVDVDFPDGRGLTPVHCCCVSGNLTLLQALVEQYSAHSNVSATCLFSKRFSCVCVFLCVDLITILPYYHVTPHASKERKIPISLRIARTARLLLAALKSTKST
jgi:hypothetical protein